MPGNTVIYRGDLLYSEESSAPPTHHISRGRAALVDPRSAMVPTAAPPRVDRASSHCFRIISAKNPGRRGGTSSWIPKPLAPLSPGLEDCSDLKARSHMTFLDMKTGGFFILEMIVGLGLLAVAAFVLVLATSRVHLASSAMADSRQATRAAEATLSQLQASLASAPPAADTQVRITSVIPPLEDENWRWVDVTAAVRGQTRTLTGRVPRHAPQTAPTEGSPK